MWISDPHPVVTCDIKKMNCFMKLYSYSERHSDLREIESIVWVCVLLFTITVQVGNQIYYINVIKIILKCLKCAWWTCFLLHLCETNRALVVTPKMVLIICMLKHIFHQSLGWQSCNKSCGFAGYRYIQSIGDFSFGALKCLTPMTDLFYFLSSLNLLLYRIFKIQR